MTVQQDHNKVKVPKRVKSIAIIGGGASGAIILDSLIKEDRFEQIVLFERRDVTGGVWVLDTKPDTLDVPPGLTQDVLDPPLSTPFEEEEDGGDDDKEVLLPRPSQQRYIHTASYQNLRTNIPEQLMSYSDEKTWNAPDELRVGDHYVRGIAIQKYIAKYLNRHESHIVYRTTVENVSKDYNDPNANFQLTLRTETDEKDSNGEFVDRWYKREFDSIIVATGHYHVPYIPNVPGLSQVYNRFPHKVRHSKNFRAVEDEFKDQTVLVIGTRASGADIVQFATDQAKKVYQSKRSKVGLRWDDAENLVLKPLVTRYELIEERDIIVHFSDGSTITNPDQIIYATGFRYSYPFLQKQYPNFTTGYIIPDLYQHTFFNKDPLLSVIGVPTDAISFRAFEYQSVLVSRFLSGKITLPPLDEQLKWSLQRFQNKGNTRAYHTIDVDNKLGYLKNLTELGGGVNSLEGTGRPFPEFNEEDLALHQSIIDAFHKFFSEPEIEDENISIPHLKP